jgi:hypothetical protein
MSLLDVLGLGSPKAQGPRRASPFGPFQGRVSDGNIDLEARPLVKMPDGSFATVRSMSFRNNAGEEVLVPTVSPDGRIMSDQEAREHYGKTKQYLGKFATPEAADQYAQALHLSQEKFYEKQSEPKKMGLLDLLRGQPGAQMPGQPRQSGLQMLLADPGARLAMAGQLMGNQGNGNNFANAMTVGGLAMGKQRELLKQTAKHNATAQWLRTQDPKYTQMLDNGVDPGDVWGLYLEDRKGADLPTSVEEYQYGLKNPGFNDWQTEQKRAGAVNVNMNGNKYGGIPQGYELVEGPEGASMRPIPGGPEDGSKKDALASNRRDVASGTIVNAADKARKAAKNRQLGGVGQGLMEWNPYSDSAEVRRQVDVLKSQATVQNLQAMRESSPTGGALGSVTAPELKMLADQAGALDPSSPNFDRDLSNYELTLLQVIHGPEAGKRVFDASRNGAAGGIDPYTDRYGLEPKK